MGFLKKFGSFFGFGGDKKPKPAPYVPSRYTPDGLEIPKGKSSFPKGQEPDRPKEPKGKTVFGSTTAEKEPKGKTVFSSKPIVAEKIERQDELVAAWAEGPLFDFLEGQFVTFSSSNVAGARYDFKERRLWVNYKDGSWYQYEDVSDDEASSLFSSGSKGGWVWDHLRVRGTVFGFQKQYMLLDGPSPENARKWHADVPGSGRDEKGRFRPPTPEDKARWRREHGNITEEGDTPDSWKQGKGPYPADYG